eukprot:1362903-Amphidinium_carterae.1
MVILKVSFCSASDNANIGPPEAQIQIVPSILIDGSGPVSLAVSSDGSGRALHVTSCHLSSSPSYGGNLYRCHVDILRILAPQQFKLI